MRTILNASRLRTRWSVRQIELRCRIGSRNAALIRAGGLATKYVSNF